MMYTILEANMDKVRNSVKKFMNKGSKLGCELTFKEVDTIKREFTDADGTKYYVDYVMVEAEGNAVINGWEFIAILEHNENGNIISKLPEKNDIEVPEKYYTTKPICEHCNTKRARSMTYIVRNVETGEFKQVGKSCLRDYTNGWSPEKVALFYSFFDHLVEFEALPASHGYYGRYYKTEDYLKCVAECVLHFGYVKSSEHEESTAYKAFNFYKHLFGGFNRYYDKADIEKTKNMVESYHLDINRKEVEELVEKAMSWINSLEEPLNNYMHNLKTLCTSKFIHGGNTGMVASLFVSYDKALEVELKKKEEEKHPSIHVGTIGDKIEVSIKELKLLTSWKTNYGYSRWSETTTYLWKIVDDEHHVFTWKTSTWIEDTAKKLKGTIKNHNEFNGTKQTELTRCKVLA